MKENKLIIGCDLHNTLVLSNKAWIKAFLSFNNSIDQKDISKDIYQKKSRKELAQKYNIDYDKLLKKYHNLCAPNIKLLNFICSLKQKGYRIILISSSNMEKVKKDLQKIEKYITFDYIYTKENFQKDDAESWNKIIDEQNADMMIYIGNDYDEDIIKNDRVISLISGHFLEELKTNNVLNKR